MTINQTEAWWVNRDAELPNRVFTVHGQNLTAAAGDWTTQSVGSAPVVVYYRLGSTGAFTQGTVTAANQYSVTFESNGDLKVGTYEVWINNRLGADYGWSKTSFDITSTPVTENTILVGTTTDYGAMADPDKLWITEVGDGTSVVGEKAAHNSALLNKLFNENDQRNRVTTILMGEGEIAIRDTIELASDATFKSAGQNMTLAGTVSSDGTLLTKLKWVGVDDKDMFTNGCRIENYTFKDFEIDANARKVNLGTKTEQYVGGAKPFTLISDMQEVRFDNLTIDSRHNRAIEIRSNETNNVSTFYGVYITNCRIWSNDMSIAYGSNLVIEGNQFRATNDAAEVMILISVNNASITNNYAESFFAKSIVTPTVARNLMQLRLIV